MALGIIWNVPLVDPAKERVPLTAATEPPKVNTAPESEALFAFADVACDPAPITKPPLGSDAALVTQVLQVRVPDPVMVPPPSGDDVATLVTVPVVVDRRPLVGNVTFVVPVVVNVSALAPLVVKLPPRAIVLTTGFRPSWCPNIRRFRLG